MKLLYSPTSPFARKVRAVILALELQPQVTLVEASLVEPSAEFLGANPLGRIPTLIADDGTALFDSAVICEYLVAIAESLPLLPHAGAARWACRRTEALADGVMDSTVARIHMLRSGLLTDNTVVKRHEAAITRTLDVLDRDLPESRLDLGTIAVCCALGFLDLRFNELDWRHGRTRLAAWFAHMADTHPCIGDTAPPT